MTHIDWSVYSLAATAFSNHGGGANLTEVDNLKERLEAVTESTLGNNGFYKNLPLEYYYLELMQILVMQLDF